jgi:hypothetical protein
MDKVDIAVFGRITRVNGDTRYNHGFVPPADVVLTDIRVLHGTQESETERTVIKYGRGVIFRFGKVNVAQGDL